MAGRVLSKANEAKLRSASEALAAILELLDKGDESESDEVKEAIRRLDEAANLGHYMESRIHLAFTQMADDMFGSGRINRDERIGLSSAIGEALNAFNIHVTANIPDVYKRQPWSDAPDAAAVEEAAAIDVAYMPLVEQAVRPDGTVALKLIAPGWGSSGYYPAEVLKRDGPSIFLKGTKNFWNHATAAEEAARPEGDLNALASELVSDARWQDGPKGPGLYADAKVFAPYQEAIGELAPHIGVSIRASGKAVQGEAEGRKGPIITALTAGKSVDYVTEAGAGGQIVEMFEAARAKAASILPIPKGVEVNEKEFKEAIGRVEAENARLRENLIARDAREAVNQALSESGLPAVAQRKLLVSLAANPPLKEGALDSAALLERVTQGVAAEVAYLQSVGAGSGRVEGMGASQSAEAPTQEALAKNLAESLTRLGIPEKMATQVAGGRW